LVKKEKSDALSLTNEAVVKSDFNPVILNGLGYVHLVREEYKESIEILKTLLDYNPYIITSHWDIIQAYRMVSEHKEAYVYSQKLINCIEDQNVFSLPSNRRISIMENDFDGNCEFFKGINEKKCYSYFTAALSSYLVDKKAESYIYIEKALSLIYCDQTKALKVLVHNINCLEKDNEEFKKVLYKFRKNIEKLIL
jgi:tetratricopeptide (TPR) repeat protein